MAYTIDKSKYIVIKTEFTHNLSSEKKVQLFDILNEINELSNGRLNEHEYLVVNQDEPYAKEVESLIISGEDGKVESN